MELQIKSRKLGKTITFSRPAGRYVYADLNGQPGTLGVQICRGGSTGGSAIECGGNDRAAFEVTCRRWYRAFVRKEAQS